MPESIDILISQLNRIDPDNPDSQWLACIKLGETAGAKNNQKLIMALLQALELKNFALTRAHAAEALGNLEIKQAVEKLRYSLKNDPYRLVRSYAARALGKLIDENDKEAIEDLIGRLDLQDEYFGVRAEAAEALGKVCEGKQSEHCEKAKLSLKKLEDEKKEKESKKIEVGAKEKDDRDGRLFHEVESALKKLEKIKEDMNNIRQEVNGLRQDVTNTTEDVEKLTEEANQSGNTSLQAKIKDLNEKLKLRMKNRADRITEKFTTLESSMDIAFRPLIVYTGA